MHKKRIASKLPDNIQATHNDTKNILEYENQLDLDKLSIEQQYVQVTYDAILEIGIDKISAREIGRRIGKSAPAVYWYLDNMDFLIAVASVKFLKNYYEDLYDIAQDNPNPLILNLLGWECFAYYAFNNVPIFANLFMEDSNTACKAMSRYYELFPSELNGIKDYLYPALITADLSSRDRLLLQHAADQNMISQDAVDYLVDCDILFLDGLFHQYRNTYAEPDNAQEAVRRFTKNISRNLSNELLEGNNNVAEFLSRYNF